MIKSTLKDNAFLWLTIKNPILPDIISSKESGKGPIICVLCKQGMESTMHLLIPCPYGAMCWVESIGHPILFSDHIHCLWSSWRQQRVNPRDRGV